LQNYASPRCVVAAILSISVTAFGPARAASVAPIAAENGMVVSAQHLATQVGVDVLRRGGNAVDAAVAVGYALAVVYPAAGNLGGGGFITIELADGRRTFLDFRETAPKGATANMYLDKDGNVIKGISTKGHLAVGVPGSVSGMEYAREKYGTMKRADLLAPAIQLAEQGFALDQGDIDLLHTSTTDFQDTIPRSPPSSSTTVSRSRSVTSWCSRSSPRRCARSAGAAPTASTRAGSATRSWHPARPVKAC
jgi:gamma-glutamyltranspeptidase/glutathione hydrolase